MNVTAAVRRQVDGTNEVDAWGMDHDVAALARSLAVLRWRHHRRRRSARAVRRPRAPGRQPTRPGGTPLLVAAAVGRATGGTSVSRASPTSLRSAPRCVGWGASSPGRTRWPACSGRASFRRCGASPTSASVIESVRHPLRTSPRRSTSGVADPARSGDGGTTGPPGAARDRPGDAHGPVGAGRGPSPSWRTMCEPPSSAWSTRPAHRPGSCPDDQGHLGSRHGVRVGCGWHPAALPVARTIGPAIRC